MMMMMVVIKAQDPGDAHVDHLMDVDPGTLIMMMRIIMIDP